MSLEKFDKTICIAIKIIDIKICVKVVAHRSHIIYVEQNIVSRDF